MVAYLDAVGRPAPAAVSARLHDAAVVWPRLVRADGSLPRVGDTNDRAIAQWRRSLTEATGAEAPAHVLFKCNDFRYSHFHHDGLSFVLYALVVRVCDEVAVTDGRTHDVRQLLHVAPECTATVARHGHRGPRRPDDRRGMTDPSGPTGAWIGGLHARTFYGGTITVGDDGGTRRMARVIVVGDGPAGLSAALFIARGDHDVVVYAQDGTAMHYALVHNYLGIDEIDGTDFQERARAQVVDAGAELLERAVTRIEPDGDGFAVTVEGGDVDQGDYVVLAGGKAAQRLAEAAGAERADGRVVVDTEYATNVDGLYAVGRVARPNRSQAVISAGAGATAALDILAREAGRDVTDWDSPDD